MRGTALSPALPSSWSRIAGVKGGLLFLGVAYFVLAKAGLALASLHPSASPIWPPSGLALAAFLLWGNRVWPAVAAGAFFANATTFGSVATSLAIAAGNTLEAAVTTWLLVRWSSGAATFEMPSRVARFAALAIAPGSVISATIGVGSLVLTGHAAASNFAHMWLTWWLGDIGGLLLATPAIVLWARSNRLPPDRAELKELSTLLAATVGAGLVAFSPAIEPSAIRGPLAFLTIAPLLWAALRHRQRDTATAALVLSAVAIAGTLTNGGPFARPSLNESFLLILSFVISAAVPTLVLSADVAVRRRAEERQQLLISELNHRVKNTLATVQAIANHTLRTADPAAFAESFSGRIQALSRAHGLMTRSVWEGADLPALLRDQVLLGENDDRVTFSGPNVILPPQTALHCAMVFHELGTNARKYGALAVAEGAVFVTWTVESAGARILALRWAEDGRPAQAGSTGPGFGTAFLEQGLRPAGEAHMRRTPTGIVWDIRVELPARPRDQADVTIPSPEKTRPPAPGPAQHRDAQGASSSANVGGKRILIVEDEPLVAMDLKVILHEAGIDVVGPARTSAAALGLLERAPLDGALLDANLGGERIDGVAAALARRGVPFAFVTGYGRESLPRSFCNIPIVSKPFVAADLLQAVRKLVASGAKP
jgi:two-component sensor histidine kinase